MHVHHCRRQSFASFEAAPTPLRNRSNPGAVPLALRLRVHLTRGRLDRQLASGRLCESTAALALRARQLGDPRKRREVARDLCGIVDYVDRVGASRVISAVVIDRRAVRDGRPAILGLAQRLEDAAPVSFRGGRSHPGADHRRSQPAVQSGQRADRGGGHLENWGRARGERVRPRPQVTPRARRGYRLAPCASGALRERQASWPLSPSAAPAAAQYRKHR